MDVNSNDLRSAVIEKVNYLPVEYTGMTPHLQMIALEELNETADNIRIGLQKVKELIRDAGIQTCTSDDFLFMFLRGKKFNPKKAYVQLKEYSYQRHLLMDYYGFMFPDSIMPIIRSGIVGVLPKRDARGRAIIYFRASKYSSILHGKSDDVLRAVQVLGHYVLKFPATQVAGLAIIVDAKFESMEVAQLLFKYMRWILPNLHTFPGRFQKIDCLNTNIFFRALVTLVRPLLPLKIFKRITFHGSSMSGLLKVYDASILPEEFGGSLGPIPEIQEKCLPNIRNYISVLHASNRYFTREDTISYPANDMELNGFFR